MSLSKIESKMPFKHFGYLFDIEETPDESIKGKHMQIYVSVMEKGRTTYDYLTSVIVQDRILPNDTQTKLNGRCGARDCSLVYKNIGDLQKNVVVMKYSKCPDFLTNYNILKYNNANAKDGSSLYYLLDD